MAVKNSFIFVASVLKCTSRPRNHWICGSSEPTLALADARYPGSPFHICTPYVGLSAPGKKIVLIGLNPTGALGRNLLEAYNPLTGLQEGAYERHVKRESGSKPSLARPRYTRCFSEVARALGEPLGLIVTNICWNASSSWKSLPKELRFPAPLDRFFPLINGECVVVVHGKPAEKHYRALRERVPSLPEPVYCPHFTPLGKGNLPDIAKQIVNRFSSATARKLATTTALPYTDVTGPDGYNATDWRVNNPLA